jgi:hypothetical protein
METGFVIGGEFPFSPEMLEQPYRLSVLDTAALHHPHFHHALTGGGYFSLKIILSDLRRRGLTQKPVLLPSYLCPSILRPFRELGVDYEFYPVGEDLLPDLNTVSFQGNTPFFQAMLVIPYFGFDFSPSTRAKLEALKHRGMILIEDRAQCLFPEFEPVGSYVFYSFRKFLPVDGSLLLTYDEIDFQTDHENIHYTSLKKYAQALRSRFIRSGEPTEEEFLRVLHQTEESYYAEGIAGFEMTNLALFSRIDIPGEISRRRAHFQLLHQLLGEFALITDPLTDTASPLCFPIRVQHRDHLQNELKEAQIFAPVHWHLSVADIPARFEGSHRLATSILSLPIRAELPDEAMHMMAEVVRSIAQQYPKDETTHPYAG